MSLRPLEEFSTNRNLVKYLANFPKLAVDSQDEEIKQIFFFDMLIDVVHLKNGVGFGELALLNDAPRSATIRAVTEVHLATLEKEDFKAILGKVMRNKFAHMIKFMYSFILFKDMTRPALEKLALFMKREEATRGQQIMLEGGNSGYVYFIEKGQFETSKDIYISKGTY